MTNTRTTEEFIEEAIKIHGVKYDYLKVLYSKSAEKITITCKVHGDFKQTPNKHLQGQGCKQCSYIKNGCLNRLSTEQFIEKAKKVHGNLYDYSQVKYVNNSTKVTINCPIHGEFEQSASSHMKGVGCKTCGYIKSSISGRVGKEFILKRFAETHSNFYTYDIPDDVRTVDIIKIICPNHNEFNQKVSVHFRSGCPKCGDERTGEYQRKKPKELDRVCRNIRRRLKSFMQNKGLRKGKSMIEILGCTWEEFKTYLENNPYDFKVDCVDLDTDHIIALSSAKTEEDVYALNHYTNLQLLPKIYNQFIKKEKFFDREHFEKWLIETNYNKC